MTLALNDIKTTLNRHKFFLMAGLVIIVLLAVVTIQQLIRVSKPVYAPLPASRQPVVGGKLDTSALPVQQSKNSLDLLKPHLPFNRTITTSTGTKVAFSIFSKTPDDPYSLYVAIGGVNFAVQKEATNYAQTIQDFRDTSDAVFTFITQNGVNPSMLYITWADLLPNQKTAESWLNVSGEFPRVVKQNGKYVFENSK